MKDRVTLQEEYRRLNEARTRAFRAPDALEYHGNLFSCTSNEALSFAIVADTLVVSSLHPHPQLFQGLTEYAQQKDKDARFGYVTGTLSLESLRKQGIYFSHVPTEAELTWVLNQGEGTLEEFRRMFKAGRAWKNVNLRDGGLTSPMAFWGTRCEISDAIIHRVIHVLGLKGTIQVQFIDTEDPVVHRQPGIQGSPDQA